MKDIKSGKDLKVHYDIDVLKKKLNNQKLKDWEDLPDIGLYIDQVLVFLHEPHMCIGNQEQNNFTRPMINNYIKLGLVPHPKGKRYNRDHLAFLVAISLFKQVMSISDAKRFLNLTMDKINPFSAFYRYKDVLNKVFDEIIEHLEDSKNDGNFIPKKIVEYSAKSYAYKFLANELLNLYEKSENEKKD